MNREFEKVLTVGPSVKRQGGIASVLSKYKENYNVPYFSSTFFQKTIFSFLFFPERVISFFLILLFNSKIESVHIHTSSEGSFLRKYLLIKIARLFKKKIVFHIHSGRFLEFYNRSNNIVKNAIEDCINNSDCLAVLSNSWKEKYEKIFNPQKVTVVPNLIPKPLEEAKNFNTTPHIKIIYLGKIFAAKGIFDLLDVIKGNYDDLSNKASFIIAGSGEEEKTHIYKKIDKYNIINFTGWVDPEEKKNLLSTSDILVLPSYSEGLPVSILEAMSYKMPIIATPVGGIPEIVENETNGRLITPGNKTELFESIMYYINDKRLIKEHGLNSYKKIEPHFPENVGKILLGIYQNI